MKVKFGKQITNQIKVARSVLAAIVSYRTVLVEAMVQVQRAGAPMSPAAFGALLDWMEAELRLATQQLYAAELAYLEEKGDEVTVGEELSDIYAELTAVIGETRTAIRRVVGERGLRKLGLGEEVPRAQNELHDYVQGAITLMKSHGVVDNGFGLTFRPADSVSALEPRVDAYRAALDDDERERKERGQAKSTRDAALAHWKLMYEYTSRQLEGMFRLAGREDMANYVRPTTRRAAGREVAEAPADAELNLQADVGLDLSPEVELYADAPAQTDPTPA